MLNLKEQRRFWSKVNIRDLDECWMWKASKAKGYGQFWYSEKQFKSHRIAYLDTYGSIPTDKPCICHHCDEKLCCNPTHLFAGTHQENMQDRDHKNRQAKEEGNGGSFLSKTEVREIRAKYIPYKYSSLRLSKEYNVSHANILRIVKNKIWKHI